MPNRLAQETSPYLLQHRNNPVDWYPWGEEALERAVEINKPILLSIGYSACHWCHVMEKECFENAEIANLMNRNFVCIKVDREERPDLDQIYQNVAQALTGGGGWPLTVFLTPARRPFFGGTYFPPEDRYGRPGFKRVLVSLAKAYATDLMGVAQNAMKLTAYIQAAEGSSSPEEGAPSDSTPKQIIDHSASRLLSMIDWHHGGIGSAPKFPNVMSFSLLWRLGQLRGSAEAREAVILTLRQMASGGIYDQIGGGFSRYSVDTSWSVPHFEKMLYDNGLLLRLYSEVLLNGELTDPDRSLFLSTVRGTVQYLLREMGSPEGGFYAAQDADSEGEEGKFFVWDPRDLAEVLPDAQERRAFSLRYGVNDGGNFEHGKTVLYLAQSLEVVAQEIGTEVEEISALVEQARKKVFEVRSKRVAPETDIKVLASWNGLAVSGLSWAAQCLRKNGFEDEADAALSAATRAFKLVSEKMVSGQDGKLASTFQAGAPKHNGYLDDYANMAMAALDLARATPDEALVKTALQMSVLWIKRVIRHFKDEKGPGYFFTSDDHEELLHRPKSVYDQAMPSGISVALECLLTLAEIDESVVAEFSAEAEKQLSTFQKVAEKNPFGCSELLSAMLLNEVGPIVVSGPGSEAACTLPWVFRKPGRELLVCHRRTCDLPISSVGELSKVVAAKYLKI